MARRYEFYVLVARTISHSFAAITREILFLPLEHKIHMFKFISSKFISSKYFTHSQFLPIVIQLFIVVPVILPPFLSDDWHVIVVAWYLTVLLLVLMIAALPTGRKNGGYVEKFVR